MVDLRGEFFRELGRQGSATRSLETTQDGWQEEAVKVIVEQLQQPDHHYLVMEAEGTSAITGWGKATVIHQIPGPGFPTGRMGLISSVVDDRPGVAEALVPPFHASCCNGCPPKAWK